MRYSYNKQGIIFIALWSLAQTVRRFSCAPDSGITGRTDGATLEWNGQIENIEE